MRLAFGMPSFAGAAMAIPLAIHITIFYSDVVLVPLGWIALAKAVSRAFDAMTDSVMGWLSDRTRTRWGRRRPYIAVGAPLAAVFFVALFAPPVGLSPQAAGWWLLACYALYYLFHTLYFIPHYGLGPELTQDYHERTRLFGLSEIFTVAGTLVAALLPAACSVLAFVIACFYPISEAVHRRIWEGIERHRRGEDAEDPITGARLKPPSGRGVDEDTGWFLDHFSARELRRYVTGGAQRGGLPGARRRRGDLARLHRD